jgi:hypothetical protein
MLRIVKWGGQRKVLVYIQMGRWGGGGAKKRGGKEGEG